MHQLKLRDVSNGASGIFGELFLPVATWQVSVVTDEDVNSKMIDGLGKAPNLEAVGLELLFRGLAPRAPAATKYYWR